MIDYNKPDDDPIVAEVRRAREEISAQFKNDLRTAFEYYQNAQPTSGRTYSSQADRSSTATKKAG